MSVISEFPQGFVPFGEETDLIHQILPMNEVHIVAGPSGVGKTTWLFQMLKDWQEGKDILGYKSYPVPFVYVSNDRSYKSTMKTMWRMNVMCPFLVTRSMQPEPKDIKTIIKIVKDKWPETRLLVLDTFTGFGPENINNNRQVTDWLKDCGRLCEAHQITILGAAHTAKVRESDKIADPRQRVLGSVAFAGFSETIFTFESMNPEDPENREFKLWALPRHGKEELFIFSKDELGKFVMKERIDINAANFVLDMFLAPGKQFTTGEIMAFAKKMPKRTVERWLTEKVSLGEVQRDGKGRYTVGGGEAEAGLGASKPEGAVQ